MARTTPYTVQANGQLLKPGLPPLIVAYRNGAPVRLDELGHVIDSVENDKTASWFNGERAIVLAIQRQPGTNTVEVVDSIKRLLPQMQQQMPPAVKLNILYDRSVSIRESVNDVKFTLLLTIALVVMVIFLFLRNVSATIIPSLALPMSIVGTFAVMYLLGLQPRQPVADGAHALGRLRGGRRHRDAGEHRPPHGDGQAAVCRPPWTARAKSASPSSR